MEFIYRNDVCVARGISFNWTNIKGYEYVGYLHWIIDGMPMFSINVDWSDQINLKYEMNEKKMLLFALRSVELFSLMKTPLCYTYVQVQVHLLAVGMRMKMFANYFLLTTNYWTSMF